MGLETRDTGNRAFLPDAARSPARSFSELYTLSLQEPSRRGAPEPAQDEAPGAATLQPTTQQLLQACLLEGGSSTGPGDLAEERTEFLHSQDSPSPRRCSLSALPLVQPSEVGQPRSVRAGALGCSFSR